MSSTGDRRSAPPVNLDVIAYQVGALQTSLDRGLAALERSQDRGFSDIRVEVAGVASGLAGLKEEFVRMDARVGALEKFKVDEEDRQRAARELAEKRADTATVDQARYRTYAWIAAPLLGLCAVGAFVIALIQAIGN